MPRCPASGLAVWHVDETQSDNTNPHSPLGGPGSGGRQRRSRVNSKNPGDDSDLFPGTAAVTKVSDTTTPSLMANDGSTTGVALSNIKDLAGVVSLKVKV